LLACRPQQRYVVYTSPKYVSYIRAVRDRHRGGGGPRGRLSGTRRGGGTARRPHRDRLPLGRGRGHPDRVDGGSLGLPRADRLHGPDPARVLELRRPTAGPGRRGGGIRAGSVRAVPVRSRPTLLPGRRDRDGRLAQHHHRRQRPGRGPRHQGSGGGRRLRGRRRHRDGYPPAIGPALDERGWLHRPALRARGGLTPRRGRPDGQVLPVAARQAGHRPTYRQAESFSAETSPSHFCHSGPNVTSRPPITHSADTSPAPSPLTGWAVTLSGTETACTNRVTWSAVDSPTGYTDRAPAFSIRAMRSAASPSGSAKTS